MAKRMLIDATHPEETRVAVVSGNRLEEFDFETTTKKQNKGNIYLAKVTRVEPSLQAAFVDYGGNRHGFLAFSEIHPDYYRLPVADREALLAEAAADDRAQAEADEAELEAASEAAERRSGHETRSAPVDEHLEDAGAEDAADIHDEPVDVRPDDDADAGEYRRAADAEADSEDDDAADGEGEEAERAELNGDDGHDGDDADVEAAAADELNDERAADAAESDDRSRRGRRRRPGRSRSPRGRNGRSRGKSSDADEFDGADDGDEDDGVETVAGDDADELRQRMRAWQRKYRIQEVIARRQIMLIQVAKEERGNKGAAITTYISLAGRYCVLMPNTPRGGGISRKIANPADRKRLKSILSELEIPPGMAVIVRTAGAQRTKAEIKRDYEYLLKLWDEIRERTLSSTAPCLIHEEGNLIKRSIRDLYSKDIDEVLVEGAEGHKTAKNFMRMLTPSHAKKVVAYDDGSMPLFHRYQVEAQIDNIHATTVQLKSGGYIVMNATEALVAIDVNSGRATRERNIEETAYRTNLEAADEIARQLRLRDLAGLIVIDFIDMEYARNRANVERRLKEALKTDRARIQVGRISAFGLLEMSRQRLRPSITEISNLTCPTCHGSGMVRSTESTALHVIRGIEEEGIRGRSSEITVYVPTGVALYLLNKKRDSLLEIEARYDLRVFVENDDTLNAPDYRLERVASHEDEGEPRGRDERLREEDEDAGGRRRGKRRRPRKDEERGAPLASDEELSGEENDEESDDAEADGEQAEARDDQDQQSKRRRRGRRGGRSRRKRRDQETVDGAEAVAAENRDQSDQVSEPLADEAAPAAGEEAEASPAGEEAQAATEETAEKAEEKPKRSRRKPKKEADSAEAEAAAGESAADAEAKPKKRTRRKKADAEDAIDQGPAETVEDEKPKKRTRRKKADETETAEKAATAEAEEAGKPKRRRTSRKKASDETAAEEASEPKADIGAAKGEPERVAAKSNGESIVEPAPAPEAGPADAAIAAEEKPAKRRGGWWNLRR